MEDNNKQQNKRPFVKDEGQKFYFTEEGKLVVESNKGVWDDGEPHVKMYGNFTCNAKTLGIIIEKFKGIPVVVEQTKVEALALTIRTSAIVNPTDDDKGLIRQNEVLLTRNNNLGKQVSDLKEELEARKKDEFRFYNAIDKFNKKPWYKRMFKKVEV